MERFHVIEEAAVILRSKGVFRQSKVYRRGDELYGAYGTGFIKLFASSGTSHPNISWDAIDIGGFGSVDGRIGALKIAKRVKQIETY